MARQHKLAMRLAIGFAVPFACHAQSAEFALRWHPSDGGPKTIEEVLVALKLASEKEESFKVRYLEVAQPGGNEQWTLASGQQVIEVSKEGELKQWKLLEDETVAPLTQREVKPLVQGMTELASACKKQ